MAIAVPLIQSLDRDEKVNLYVQVSAIETVLHWLLQDVFEDVLTEKFLRDDLEVSLTCGVTLGDLARELWPEDEDATGDAARENRPENLLATIREEMLVSRMFASLIDRDDTFKRLAEKFSGLAELGVRTFDDHSYLGRHIHRYYMDPAYRALMPCGECGVVGGCEHFPNDSASQGSDDV